MGKFVIGAYLGNSGLASTYGAAGSVVLLLVWVYYSAQVFLLGAGFTHSYAYQLGSLCSAGRARAAGDAGTARVSPSDQPRATPLKNIKTQILVLVEAKRPSRVTLPPFDLERRLDLAPAAATGPRAQ
jgi:hypothetical protein